MNQQNQEEIPIITEGNQQVVNIQPYELPRRLDQFDQPMEFYCTRCQKNRISVLRYENGKYTWLCCVFLCLFAGVMAFLPFYIKDCRDVEHHCPACSEKVGVKQFKAC